MLGIAARNASEWNTWAAPDLAGRRTALTEACETAGRSPATMWTSVNALVELGKSAPTPGYPAIAGTAQQLVDQLGQYADLGFDEFILPDWNLGKDKAERADNLARVKDEVLGQLPA
jgi:alkanesulfonate monooxygenase SsuD/methylene tetrahydromethanopterin reductase-like flavin-dependent oxidoreductase (luciferase family)